MVNNLLIEAQKEKVAKKIFFNKFDMYLSGRVIEKIAPFKNLNFDLLYIENFKAMIIKFIDTTEEIFSILGEEIIEIIEEESNLLRENLKKEGLLDINFYVFMPFVDLERNNISSSNIIDKKMLSKIKTKSDFTELMSRINVSEEELVYNLAREKYSLDNDAKCILSKDKLFELDNLIYGNTLIKGSSGTGKTTFMLSAILRLSKIYPNEKFLYITFDKYLKYKIKNILEKELCDNVRIINFHQFIILLGKKYNLRLKTNSRKNFSFEFFKIFNRVKNIYLNKRYYKGIFVDEAENFNVDEVKFLNSLVHLKKGIFFVSFDKAKKLSSEVCFEYKDLHFHKKINFDKNFYSSNKVALCNKKYQSLINKFSALEIGELRSYFDDFVCKTNIDGNVELIKYNEDYSDVFISKIRDCINRGYDYSDICIVFPYNKNKSFDNIINSKEKIHHLLEKNNISCQFVDDGFISKKGIIAVSNIFNIVNMEFKIVFFCQMESLYMIKNDDDVKRALNIIYTATTRAKEELYIFMNEIEDMPSTFELLYQSFEEM